MELPIVLIKAVDCSEVAQVPVERCLISGDAPGDSGHHHVAAVSRIAGDGEMPRVLLRRCGRADEENEEYRGGDAEGRPRAHPLSLEAPLNVITVAFP